MKDHNLSKPSGAKQPPGPTRQHHRLACGAKVNGETNPNGGKGSTDNKVANAKVNY